MPIQDRRAVRFSLCFRIVSAYRAPRRVKITPLRPNQSRCARGARGVFSSGSPVPCQVESPAPSVRVVASISLRCIDYMPVDVVPGVRAADRDRADVIYTGCTRVSRACQS